MKNADHGTMNKSGFKPMAATMTNNATETMKMNSGWGVAKLPDPKTETTLQMYNAQGKKPKAPVLVSNKKGELESTQWTDKVFTGDNSKTTAALSAEAGKRDLLANPNRRRVVAESVTKAIEERLARASAMATDNGPATLDKVVDKKHVMDIRRALRRKYASRTNLHRIFQQWDRENKGGISVPDLYLGLNKIGISVNLDQAQALHGLAIQTDDDPNLSLQEFSDLLFTSDETFSTDKLAKTQPMNGAIE